MKNILVIPPFNPYPLTSGGHQAIYNGIAILKDIANVYVVVSVTQSQCNKKVHLSIQSALPFVKVIPYILPESKHTWLWYIRVLTRKIFSVFQDCNKKTSDNKTNIQTSCIQFICEKSDDYHSFISDIIVKHHIDIVQCEMLPNISICKVIPRHIKAYFVHHELGFVRNQLVINNNSCVTKNDINDVEDDKCKEIRYLNMYDLIITLSDVDSKKLKQAGVTRPIHTSMAVVRDSVLKLNDHSYRNTLTFIGPETHLPNHQGVLWFLNECWPILKRIDSSYSLQIIGLWSPNTIQSVSTKYEGVKFLGFVDNLSEVVYGTTMIVPINIGSGIRMKILEAARLNVPVVSTVVGAEGLPIEDGVHAFITNDASQFVEDIIKLQDESLRRKFVNSTNELISKNYSVEALMENRLSLYR